MGWSGAKVRWPRVNEIRSILVVGLFLTACGSGSSNKVGFRFRADNLNDARVGENDQFQIEVAGTSQTDQANDR